MSDHSCRQAREHSVISNDRHNIGELRQQAQSPAAIPRLDAPRTIKILIVQQGQAEPGLYSRRRGGSSVRRDPREADTPDWAQRARWRRYGKGLARGRPDRYDSLLLAPTGAHRRGLAEAVPPTGRRRCRSSPPQTGGCANAQR